jgi:hypothetical protein
MNLEVTGTRVILIGIWRPLERKSTTLKDTFYRISVNGANPIWGERHIIARRLVNQGEIWKYRLL